MSNPPWQDYRSSSQDSAMLTIQPSTGISSFSSNINSPGSAGVRETGIIEKLLHSYGFIQCCERQARLFFHYSQFSGNIEHLKIGDPVEFEMTYDRKTGKPIASNVVKISPEVIAYEVLGEERVLGTVTTEIKDTHGSGSACQGRISYESRGECFFLPYTVNDIDAHGTVLKSGDKVTFLISTDKSGSLAARHIQMESPPPHLSRYNGVVCFLKDSFGFIERADVVKEIFFHNSEVVNGDIGLGDEVEFGIQFRNNKEVAVNITALPEGSVVFEDIGKESEEGTIIKPLDRASLKHQSDPLSGKILWNKNGKEVELPYGDKDQKGECTLMQNDKVQFHIATDRRDRLQRATAILLCEESLYLSEEERELGVVTTIKDGFGFLRCQEREQRMFFHFNELLDPNCDIRVQDEVEFTVTQDLSSPSRLNAIRIKTVPKGTVKFDVVGKEMYTGIVEKEAGSSFNNRSPSKTDRNNATNEQQGTSSAGIIAYYSLPDDPNDDKDTVVYYNKDCDPRNAPKTGDKVQFSISENKSNGKRFAVEIKVLHRETTKSAVRCNQQGFIAALKDGFGFIETASHDDDVFFHYSAFDGDANQLDLGTEVEYSLLSKGGKVSAEFVRRLTKGSLPMEEMLPGTAIDGRVIRPVRWCNPEQEHYSGLVEVLSDDESDEEKKPVYEFGVTSLVDKREFLQKGDPVQFQLGLVKSSGKVRAVNLKAVRKRLQANVDAIKGQFGFLQYEAEEGRKLFFHISEVKENATLATGDRVEFTLVHNQRTGRYSACNVVKVSNPSEVQRPERLVSRLRTASEVTSGPRLIVIRQPRGPDTSAAGFAPRRRLSSSAEEDGLFLLGDLARASASDPTLCNHPSLPVSASSSAPAVLQSQLEQHHNAGNRVVFEVNNSAGGDCLFSTLNNQPLSKPSAAITPDDNATICQN